MDYFIIERSTDDANFTPLTTHPAVGNSPVLSEYFIDDYAVLPNVNYYYRVKIVNLDGSIDYTHSVVASLTKDGNVQTINLFPNPVTNGGVTLEITSTADRTSDIVVYDAIGQLITNRKVDVKIGVNTYRLETQDWPVGVYYIHIKSAAASTVKELIKAR